MTRMVDRLEKRGLISRVRKSDDRRVIDLVLTPDGQALGRRLPSIYAAVVNSNFAGLRPDEMAILKTLLRKSLACESNSCDGNPGGN
jgi:DNA-binding MarR family transcriptional regulator